MNVKSKEPWNFPASKFGTLNRHGIREGASRKLVTWHENHATGLDRCNNKECV